MKKETIVKIVIFLSISGLYLMTYRQNQNIYETMAKTLLYWISYYASLFYFMERDD